MKKNHSRFNLNKLLSKEDLELLKDGNRRKELVERCFVLVMEAKGDISKGISPNNKSRDSLFFILSSMIRYYMNRWFDNNPEDFDEIINESYLIFVDAIEKFNPEKSNNFISFFKMYLFNQHINRLKRETMIVKKNVINMGELSEEEIDTVYSVKYDDTDDFEIKDVKTNLEEIIKNEWKNNETDESIAEKLDVSVSLIDKIRKKLKYDLELEWGKINNFLF